MSYILDALRKVERERRHQHPPAIGLSENRTHHSRSRWGVIIVIILIVLNLIWFAWNSLNQNKPDNLTTEALESIDDTSLNPIQPKQLNDSYLPKKTNQKKPKPEHSVQSRPESTNSQISNLSNAIARFPRSIHDLKAQSEQQLRQQRKNSLNGRLKPATKPTPKPVKSQQRSVQAKQAIHNKVGTTLNQAPPRKIKTPDQVKPNIARPVAKTKPVVKHVVQQPANKSPVVKQKPVQKKRIPLLEQMPGDFQEQIPEMTINVYAQEEHAENAFVIINMRKYRIGDSIDSGLVLKEIGVDGMTLSKQGKLFVVPRP